MINKHNINYLVRVSVSNQFEKDYSKGGSRYENWFYWDRKYGHCNY